MKIGKKTKQLMGRLFASEFWEKMTDDSEWQNELRMMGYGEKSLLTAGGDSNPMYQIIDMGDSFLFVDADKGVFITDFDDIPEAVMNAGRNFVLRKKEITSVDIGVGYDESDDGGKLIEYAQIRLRWRVRVKDKRGSRTSRRFLSLVLTDEIEEEKLRAFFSGSGRLRIMPEEEFDRQNGHILTSGEVSLRRKLKRAIVAMPIASALCIFCELLPSGWVRNTFIVIGALLPFALFALIVIFPRYLLVRRGEDSRWDETKWDRTIDTEPALIITVGAQFMLMIACESRLFPLADGGFGRWAAIAAVPTVLVACALVLVAFSQTSGWKDRLYAALLCCLFFATFSCFSGVYLLNGALDSASPDVHSAQVEKKWIERGYRGGDVFCLRTVRPDGTKEDFVITESEYKRAGKGDTITVEEYSGAFGIPYKMVVVTNEKSN